MNVANEEKLISNLIDPEVFKDLKCKLYLSNNTSGTEIIDPEQIRMSEFGKNFCTLNLPQNSCSDGHMLTLCIVPEETKSEVITTIPTNGIPGSITILGKAGDIQNSERNSTSLHFLFTQYIENEWENFIGQYEARQILANKILKQVKN